MQKRHLYIAEITAITSAAMKIAFFLVVWVGVLTHISKTHAIPMQWAMQEWMGIQQANVIGSTAITDDLKVSNNN